MREVSLSLNWTIWLPAGMPRSCRWELSLDVVVRGFPFSLLYATLFRVVYPSTVALSS
jgi:hypothetical protein